MQSWVCRFLFSNFYAHLSNSPRFSTLNSALIHPPFLTSTPRFSSIPNRPTRGNRRRDKDDGSEDQFLRNLDFGDDGYDLKQGRSHQNSPSQIPNRPLRGEKPFDPPRRTKWPDGSEELFPDLDSESSRTRRSSSVRTHNRPMRGGAQRDEDGQFQSKVRAKEQIFGKDFGSPCSNAPTQFDDDRQISIGEDSKKGSSKIGDHPEDHSKAGDLFQNLKFGEDRSDKKVEESELKASTHVAGADSAVSEASMKDADEIFKKMKETGLIPNAVAMLDGLCKDGLVPEAMKLFGLIREKGSIPEVVVYTAVVEGFCKAEKFDDAKMVFKKMQKNEIDPNAFTYTVLIQGLCKGRKLEDSVAFCVEMLSAGHSPNAATFTGLVEGFCTEKGKEEAENVIKALRGRGFAVDEKAIGEHLDKKGPFSPIVREAIFGKKTSRMPF